MPLEARGRSQQARSPFAAVCLATLLLALGRLGLVRRQVEKRKWNADHGFRAGRDKFRPLLNPFDLSQNAVAVERAIIITRANGLDDLVYRDLNRAAPVRFNKPQRLGSKVGHLSDSLAERVPFLGAMCDRQGRTDQNQRNAVFPVSRPRRDPMCRVRPVSSLTGCSCPIGTIASRAIADDKSRQKGCPRGGSEVRAGTGPSRSSPRTRAVAERYPRVGEPAVPTILCRTRCWATFARVPHAAISHHRREPFLLVSRKIHRQSSG